MASSPPGGGWMPSAETLKTVGHGLLDAAGLIPIIGEPADIINAAWLAAEGNYLDAGLSLISVVPIVGDAIGKGGKVAKALGGKALGKVADLVRTMDFEKTLGKLLSDPRLAPYAKPIVDALNKWRDDLVDKFPSCKPGGALPCGKVAAKATAKTMAQSLRKMAVADARKLLQDMPYADRLAALKELATDPNLLDVATKAGTAVFYSGRVPTADGFISARTLAENLWAHGKTTLENTPGGKFLNDLGIYDDILRPDDADEIWKALSGRYADGATGDVLAYIGDMRPGAILPHELEVLAGKQAAGAIKSIKVIEIREMLERLGK